MKANKPGKKTSKNGKRSTAFSRSLAGISEKVSARADRVADIILDGAASKEKTKTRKVTRETVSMLKDVAGQFKENIKEVRPRDFLCDAAYGVGKMTRFSYSACVRAYNFMME